MEQLTPEQRHNVYTQAAARAGIHQPILAALYQVQQQPQLADGATGLGISPANRIPLEQLTTFGEQVQVAANTIRSLTNSLTVEGWKGEDIWHKPQGRYTDTFLRAIARGFVAPYSDATAAQLESCDDTALQAAYIRDSTREYERLHLLGELDDLDAKLLAFLSQLPRYYSGLPYQREALLELVRVWRKLDSREATLQVLEVASLEDEASLGPRLMQFVQRVPTNYRDYPHQREALLRLIQLWHQVDSRSAAIAALLTHPAAELNRSALDPALMALVQRIPSRYQGKGEQRNALVEAFRAWQQLETRSDALVMLGIEPDLFTAPSPPAIALENAAIQVDQALLEFMRCVPFEYRGGELQREALLLLTQLWRGLETPEQAQHSLLEDLRRLERAGRDAPDGMPQPKPQLPPPRPAGWQPTNLQLHAPILPNGHFLWADATRGGTQMPPNQATVDAIIQLAQQAQQARDRLDRPFRIIEWYRPSLPASLHRPGQARHALGDAMVFYCEGLTGNQIYWFLDPWWIGGLGRYSQFPTLCYVDARGIRVRWLQTEPDSIY